MREGWVVFELGLERELEAATVAVLVVEEEEDAGVECAMYMFEAVDIALVSRVVARDGMTAGFPNFFFWLARER